MKKSNDKVNVAVINFTKIVYNNLIVNVNTDNSNNNELPLTKVSGFCLK